MLHEINSDLLELEKSLSALGHAYPDLARACASARINYELDYAGAIDDITHDALRKDIKMTVAEKEAQAALRTKDTLTAYRTADAELDGAKKQIDILQSILMSTQSRVKLEMIERGLAGMAT